MKKSIAGIICILILFSAHCTTTESMRHRYTMKGQVVSVGENEIYLCVGTRDGAEIGQDLKAYRIVRRDYIGQIYIFVRKPVGLVKIIEVLDEHFARAQVISGKVEKEDTVETEE